MFKNTKAIIHHILIFVLSAAIALSLPYTGKFIADNYQAYWLLIESDMVLLNSLKIAFAVLLIIFFNFLERIWNDRKFSKIATNDMGLVLVAHAEGRRTKKRVKKLKEQNGLAKDVLLLGSTGFGTFVNPEGDMHHIIQNCRKAEIMLLNPSSEGAIVRAKSIPDPDITPESLREQIIKSIEFLKSLRALQKDITLKLYEETPFLKLAILGDYIFMKHYYAGLVGQDIPEYIFKHSPNQSSLFHFFYQFFRSKWRDPNIPEYDFDSDELVYKDIFGNEVKREKLEKGSDLEVSDK